MSRLARLGQSLYDGRVSIDFVGRKWLWYGVSAVIILVALVGLFFKQLNLGIEFEGGVEYRVSFASGQADDDAVTAVRDAVVTTEIEDASSPIVNTSGTDGNLIRVQTEPLTTEESTVVDEAIRGVEGVEDLSSSQIGPSWGQQVAERALTGLVVFLVLVVLMIWAYFREWKMSVAALVALAHDLIITIGVYALVGLRGHPRDRHRHPDDPRLLALRHRGRLRQGPREHRSTSAAPTRPTPRRPTWRSTRRWCGRSTPRSWRCCPVGALLYVGVVTLGSGALKDLALALFVGMAAGAYSSIFIATPLLVQLKELEPGVKAGDQRARRHRSRQPVDRFAEVPVFREDMPILDDPDDPDAPPAGRGGDRPARPVRRPRAATVRCLREHRAGSPPGSAPARPVRCRTRRPPVGRSPAASPARGGASSERPMSDHRRPPAEADPRRPRLPRARHRLQGHHAAAGRPRGLPRRSCSPWRLPVVTTPGRPR